jgi:hypothetical protein
MSAQETTPQPESGSEAPGSDSAAHVLRLFREAYFTLMDDLARVWQRHCDETCKLSAAVTERLAQATSGSGGQNAAAPTAAPQDAIVSEFNDARRQQADSAFGGLRAATARYAQSMGEAWKAAADTQLPDATAWQIGAAQMDVATQYGALVRALRQ